MGWVWTGFICITGGYSQKHFQFTKMQDDYIITIILKNNIFTWS